MRRYFITGGTGFIGRELVRQLLKRADTELITCLTRGQKPGYIAHEKVEYLIGDICDFAFPPDYYTDLIHGANEVNDTLQPDQHRYYYTITEGTNRVLRWAATTGIARRIILSSGAVARDTIYGRAKRQSEILCRHYLGNTKIARIYAVLGPEMPLNGQYAAGRFVHQAIAEKRVRYYGGESLRTYLDVSDCARWLLQILDQAAPLVPVDVSGNEQIRIGDLARRIADVFGVPAQKVDGPDRIDNYLPDLTRADELGLVQTLDINESLRRIHAAFSTVRHPDLEPAL